MSEEEIKILDNIIKKIEECMKNNNVTKDTKFYLPIGGHADFGFVSYDMLLNIRNLQQENTQLKMRIEKAIEYYEIIDNRNTYVEISELRHLINLLKGDKE